MATSCGYREVMDADGTCRCLEGWLRNGDMRTALSPGCDVNIQFVRAMYGFSLFILTFCLLHSLYEIAAIVRMKGWRKLFVSNAKKIASLHAVTILSSTIFIAAYSLKIAEPERSLGEDATLTWLFMIALTFFFCIVAIAHHMVISLSLRQEKFAAHQNKFVWVLAFTTWFMPMLAIVMWTGFLLVLVSVYVRGEGDMLAAERLVMAFYFIVGILSFFLIFVAPIALYSAIRDLESMVDRSSGGDSKYTKDAVLLLNKFRFIRIQTVFRSILNAAVFTAFGISSEARYWSPYMIDVMALLVPFVTLGLSSLTTAKEIHSGSSSRGSKTTHMWSGRGSKRLSRDSKEETTIVTSPMKRSSKEELIVNSITLFEGADTTAVPTPTTTTYGSKTLV